MQAFLGTYIHFVFSTKGRMRFLQGKRQKDMWAYLGGICRRLRMKALAIGGWEDHVHLLVALPADMTLARAINLLKSNSSKWMRQDMRQFAWQKRYGAFSVSASMLPTVKEYIANQEEHHRKHSFEDEFLALLKRYGVEYDPKYVFD